MSITVEKYEVVEKLLSNNLCKRTNLFIGPLQITARKVEAWMKILKNMLICIKYDS